MDKQELPKELPKRITFSRHAQWERDNEIYQAALKQLEGSIPKDKVREILNRHINLQKQVAKADLAYDIFQTRIDLCNELLGES